MNTCERPKCRNTTTGDLRYCSDRCYDLDNDELTPVTVGSITGIGMRTPVILPGTEAARQLKALQDEFAQTWGVLDPPAEPREAS